LSTGRAAKNMTPVDAGSSPATPTTTESFRYQSVKEEENMPEEKWTRHQIRTKITQEFRETTGTFMRKMQPVDGYVVALIKEEILKNGDASTCFASAVSSSLHGVEAAADVASKAVMLLMSRFHMTFEEAMASFKTRTFERYRHHEISAKKELLEKVIPDALGMLMGQPPEELLQRLPPHVAEKIRADWGKTMKEPEPSKEPEKPAESATPASPTLN